MVAYASKRSVDKDGTYFGSATFVTLFQIHEHSVPLDLQVVEI
jgi:hypothetical protein